MYTVGNIAYYLGGLLPYRLVQ